MLCILLLMAYGTQFNTHRHIISYKNTKPDNIRYKWNRSQVKIHFYFYTTSNLKDVDTDI